MDRSQIDFIYPWTIQNSKLGKLDRTKVWEYVSVAFFFQIGITWLYICKTDAEIRPESFAIAHSALVKSFSIVENSQEKKVYGTYVRSRPLGNHNGNG
ncbi:hypothetical protein [Nostoc sp. JL23]|uniref:hypothetical protein n=1 Tax=Nostoc sp. JL23 TaxID=2815394 RepID=UPI001DF60C57|nr:hypothetical protein [Nostoc sp. JL23]MBN3877026.1 hypothetical protein [Nostoc sp. JL23]